jgi:hypothetical protein
MEEKTIEKKKKKPKRKPQSNMKNAVNQTAKVWHTKLEANFVEFSLTKNFSKTFEFSELGLSV